MSMYGVYIIRKVILDLVNTTTQEFFFNAE